MATCACADLEEASLCEAGPTYYATTYYGPTYYATTYYGPTYYATTYYGPTYNGPISTCDGPTTCMQWPQLTMALLTMALPRRRPRDWLVPTPPAAGRRGRKTRTEPAAAAARLQQCGAEAATVWSGGCNRVERRLQPYGAEAATVWSGGCNRTHGGCDSAWWGLLL